MNSNKEENKLSEETNDLEDAEEALVADMFANNINTSTFQNMEIKKL